MLLVTQLNSVYRLRYIFGDIILRNCHVFKIHFINILISFGCCCFYFNTPIFLSVFIFLFWLKRRPGRVAMGPCLGHAYKMEYKLQQNI